VSDVGSLAGQKIGPFNIARLLGHGGMGEVYEALDEVLDRHVALKVLRSNLARDPGFVERFLREARAAARLNHPNIVQIYAVGDIAGLYYISMEYIRGATVAQFIKRLGRLEVGQALRVTRHAAQALADAHQKGIVHRDIKPANLMVDQIGRVKVMDFGLAKQMDTTQVISGDGFTVGTPYYMAPEQIEGDQAGPRSDLYSLGVTLFEMLAGQPPFVGGSLPSLLQRVLSEPFPDVRTIRPDVPPDVGRIVTRLTAKRPEARYASAETVIADVHKAHEALQKTMQEAGDSFGLNIDPAALGADSGQGLRDKSSPHQTGSQKKSWRWIALATLCNVGLWAVSFLCFPSPAKSNRAIEFLDRGMPAIEALAEADRMERESPTEENRRIESEIRQRLLAEAQAVFQESTFKPTPFVRAYADLARAAQINPVPELLDLKLKFETQWKEYGLTLTRVEAANNAAVFQLEGVPPGIGESVLREGETLRNRFLVTRISSSAVVLEDLAVRGRTLTVLVQDSFRGAQYSGELQDLVRPSSSPGGAK